MNKKVTQILLGVGVSVMALGASAFTTNMNRAQFTFTKVSGPDNSLNPSDYEYQPSNDCLDNNPNRNCSAMWEEASAPSVGDHPSGTLITSSVTKGSRIQ